MARELALRLLTRASTRDGAPEGKTALAAFVCDELQDQLSVWVGRAGVRVLLQRALVLARRDHAALAPVVIGDVGAPCVQGVDAALSNADERAVFEGLLAVLVTFIDLLGRFLGENLTTAMVEQNWNQPTDDSPNGDRSADHDG